MAKTKATKERREGTDCRRAEDRRKSEVPVAEERRGDDRRKVQRRRQIDPTTCERDYSDEEIEFMQSLDNYKRDSGRMFPTCSEILEVLRSMGYFRLNEEQRQLLGLELSTLPVGEGAETSEEEEEEETETEG